MNNAAQMKCPECGVELDPAAHRFCYGCGLQIVAQDGTPGRPTEAPSGTKESSAEEKAPKGGKYWGKIISLSPDNRLLPIDFS